MGTLKKIFRKLAKWIGIVLLVLIGLVVVVILLIRTPWAQEKIVNYATSYASDKTGTTIDIDRLFVTFSGNVQLEGLYVEGQKQDTLLYSHSLEAGVGVHSLFGDEIRVTGVDWEGLRAHVVRRQDSSFNFTFIIDAFAGSGGDTATAETAAQTDTASSTGISVGPINFTNFHITYLDSISGIDAMLRLGSLSLTTEELDLDSSRFEVDEIALRNTMLRADQFLQPPPSDDTSSSAPPFISWNEIALENIQLNYSSTADTMEAAIDLGLFTVGESQLELAEEKIALANLELLRTDIRFRSGIRRDTMDVDAQIGTLAVSGADLALADQVVSIESIEFSQNDISLLLPAGAEDTATVAEKSDTAASEPFAWPEWQVELGELLLAENNIRLDRGQAPAPEGVFDPDHLGFQNLSLELRDVALEDRAASLDLLDFAFAERSGFVLEKLALTLQVNNRRTDLSDLQLVTNNSRFNASLLLNYRSIDSLMADPMSEAEIDLDFEEPISLNLSDAFYFNDSLRYDTLFQTLAAYPINLRGQIQGNLKDIELERLELRALAGSRVLIDGRIRGLPDTTELHVNIPTISIYTTVHDIAQLTDTAGIVYPDYIRLNASLTGDVEELEADVAVSTPDGGIDLEGHFADLLEVPKYRGVLDVNTIDVGGITGNPDLGPVSMSLDFDGRGMELETLQLQTDFDFQQLTYKEYDYSKLNLQASVQNQQADVHLSHIDENLDFDLDLDALLDSENTVADLVLDLRGVDLNDLNLSDEEMKIALGLNASFEGNPKNFDSEVKMTRGIFIKEDDSYRLDSIFAALHTDDSLTDLKVVSEILEGDLHGNRSLPRLASAIQAYMGKVLLSDSIDPDSALYNDLEMHGQFTISGSPLLTDIFVPNLTRMDSISVDIDFKPSKEKLALNVDVPEIVYGESELRELAVNLNAGHDTLQLNLGFDHLMSGPIEMHQTLLDVDVTDNQGNAVLQILDGEEQEVLYTSVDVFRRGEFPVLRVGHEHLVLNSKPWSIDSTNEITLRDNFTNFSNFVLSRNQQELRINTDTEAREMMMDFSNFDLAAIFSALNSEQSPLGGSLNGDVRLLGITENPAFVADLRLEDLTAMGTQVGTLELDAHNREADNYVLDLGLQGQYIDLRADGSYSTAGETANLSMGIDLNELQLALVEDFAPGQVRHVEGGISGHFDVEGPTSDLQYRGKLTFNNASFEPIMLGSRFTINNSSISVDNTAVNFNNFSIADANGDKLRIRGKVGVENTTNPEFDLNVKAENFTALNSTKEDNDLFWGKAVVSVDVGVGGDLELPEVDAQVKIGQGTDVTYAIPATQAQMEERTGLVRFRDMKDTLNVLSMDEDEESDLITGMDVSAYLEVNPDARFNVIVDPQSNDRLSIAGEANLNFELSPNGNTDLSGSYEVTDGSYRLRLYELVQKEFHLREGSRIVWSGDPTGATLDLTALYKTETSPVDLMAQQLSGADQATINRYKQKLPFHVLLYINGTMEQPEVSFGLDMPDESKDAMGGSVYTRVQQLEQDENELNKQVFSLIVFNRFLPSGVGGDEGGGTSALARSSVSNLLTNQLNQLSDRYVQGVELNFDVDSYTDYRSGTAQQQTDLNISLRKSFLDDRVVVEVGSQVGVQGDRRSSSVIADASVEYLLTEDGRYRARAFRKNQYQDILEGQVIIMGLGILFNREFDTFKELMEGAADAEEADEGDGSEGEDESGENSNGNSGTREENDSTE